MPLWQALIRVSLLAVAARGNPNAADGSQLGTNEVTLYSPFYVSKDGSDMNRTWNALTSWTHVVPQRNVIMFTELATSCQWLQHRFPSMLCVTSCKHNQVMRQDLRCVTATAAALAATPYLCLINSDIVLLPDFKDALLVGSSLAGIQEPLVVGQRTNVLMDTRIDFDRLDWAARVSATAKRAGKLDGSCALDYFFHKKGMWQHVDMPPFVTGVMMWDRYLLSEANMHPNVTTVDATRSITAVHLKGTGYKSFSLRKDWDMNDRIWKSRTTTARQDEGSTNKTDLYLSPDASLQANACSSKTRFSRSWRLSVRRFSCVPIKSTCGVEFAHRKVNG